MLSHTCRASAAPPGSPRCAPMQSPSSPPAAASAHPPLRTRLSGNKHLVDFAVRDALGEAALRVAADDAAPETHRGRIPQIFGDLPAPGEATEYQLYRGLPYPQTPPRARDEELRQAIVDARLARGRQHAHHARKTHRLLPAQNDERIGVGVSEPVRDLIRLAVTDLPEPREQAGAGIEVIEVIAVDALDPQAVGRCRPGIAHTHCGDDHRQLSP